MHSLKLMNERSEGQAPLGSNLESDLENLVVTMETRDQENDDVYVEENEMTEVNNTLS